MSEKMCKRNLSNMSAHKYPELDIEYLVTKQAVPGAPAMRVPVLLPLASLSLAQLDEIDNYGGDYIADYNYQKFIANLLYGSYYENYNIRRQDECYHITSQSQCCYPCCIWKCFLYYCSCVSSDSVGK